jgi:type I restriction enzyme, S subunit
VAFGDVVRLSGERSSDPQKDGIERYVGLDHIDPGELKIRRWGEVTHGTTFTNVFRPGHVLFGKRRAYQRKVAVADFVGVCSSDIYVFEAKRQHLRPELLSHICRAESFFSHAIGTSAGSLSPRTNWSSLVGYEFDLPPLTEQERISENLSATETLQQATRELNARAWTIRLSAYAHLTTGGAGVGLTTAVPAKLPRGWRVCALRDVVQIENNRRKPIRAGDRALIQGPYPYYGATGQLDSLNEFAFDGQYALIGEDGDHFLKYALWSMTHLVLGRFNVSNHAHVLKGSDSCTTEWIYHYFRHRDIRAFLTKQGSGRLKLKKASLETMPILLPPVAQQGRFAEILTKIAGVTDSVVGRHAEVAHLAQRMRQEFLGYSDVQ